MRILSLIITLSLLLTAESGFGGRKKRNDTPGASADGLVQSSSNASLASSSSSTGIVSQDSKDGQPLLEPINFHIEWFELDFKEEDLAVLTELQKIQRGRPRDLKEIKQKYSGFDKIQLIVGQLFKRWFWEGQVDEHLREEAELEMGAPLLQQFGSLVGEMGKWVSTKKQARVQGGLRLDKFARFFGEHFAFAEEGLDPFSYLLLGGGLIGFRYAEASELPTTPYKSILWEIGTSLFSQKENKYSICEGVSLFERKRLSARYLQRALFTRQEIELFPRSADRWSAMGELILEGWVMHWNDKFIPMHGREKIAEECFQLGQSPIALFNLAKLIMERAYGMEVPPGDEARSQERKGLFLRAAVSFRLSKIPESAFYMAQMVRNREVDINFHFLQDEEAKALLEPRSATGESVDETATPLQTTAITDENRIALMVALYREAGARGLIYLGDEVLRGHLSPVEVGLGAEMGKEEAAARLYAEADTVEGEIKNAGLLLREKLRVNPFSGFESLKSTSQGTAVQFLSLIVRLGQRGHPKYKGYHQALASSIANSELDIVPDLANPDQMIEITPENRSWLAGRSFLLGDSEESRVKGAILCARNILSLPLEEVEKHVQGEQFDKILRTLLEVEDQPAQKEARRLTIGLLLKEAYTPALFPSKDQGYNKAAALLWVWPDAIGCQVLGSGIAEGRFPLDSRGQFIPPSQRLIQGATLSQACGLSGGWRQLGDFYLYEGLGEDFTNGEVGEEKEYPSNPRRLALRRAWFCYDKAQEMDPETDGAKSGLILVEACLDKSRMGEAFEEVEGLPLPDSAIVRAYLLWEQGVTEEGKLINPDAGETLLHTTLAALDPLYPEEKERGRSRKLYPIQFNLHKARICYTYARTLEMSDSRLKPLLECVREAYTHVPFPYYEDMLRKAHVERLLKVRSEPAGSGQEVSPSRDEKTEKSGSEEAPPMLLVSGGNSSETLVALGEEQRASSRSSKTDSSGSRTPSDSGSRTPPEKLSDVLLGEGEEQPSVEVTRPKDLPVSSSTNLRRGRGETEDPVLATLFKRATGGGQPHKNEEKLSPSLASPKPAAMPPAPRGIWAERAASEAMRKAAAAAQEKAAHLLQQKLASSSSSKPTEERGGRLEDKGWSTAGKGKNRR